MKKDFHSLGKDVFELAIVGGGIHGATLAREAAAAGYRVALVEMGDFGGATSANSLKIIHGGIRYLQHGDIKRMRESISCRRAMMRFAPHLVKAQPCLMPTYGHGIKGRELMRIAFGVYDLIAFDRNQGLSKENRLANGASISPVEVKKVVAGIRAEGLTGGAVWYDAIALNTERLILEYVKEAVRLGAVAANYVKATEVVVEAGRVAGLKLEDRLRHGTTTTLRCKVVVNATGPYLGEYTAGEEGGDTQRWAVAINLVVKKKLFDKYAVGLEGYTAFSDKDALIKRGKRLFFFVPWRGDYTMIGTGYTPYTGEVEDFQVSREEIASLLAEINKIYPAARLSMDDITFCHGGLLPMDGVQGRGSDTVQLDKSSRIIDHHRTGGTAGLYSIKGVKYTTAPDIAEKMVAVLQKNAHLTVQKKPSPKSISCSRESADAGNVPSISKGHGEVVEHLKKRYGTGWDEVFAFFSQPATVVDGQAVFVSHKPPLLYAELLYFIRQEMAETLEDVVLRRSDLGSAECPPIETLLEIASLMAGELAWSDAEKEEQLAQVMGHYSILNKTD